MSSDAAPGDAGLSAPARARGRRLAIISHPAGMTHRLVYTDQLPTLALVALGGSEAVVGLQRAFEPIGQLLQLPTLRLVGRVRKRSILIAGQVLAVVAGLPLLAFGVLHDLPAPWPVVLALTSLALTAVGVVVSQTVWFPLLRQYVEPDRIGQFFGALRSWWHFVLIAYFLAAQRWLAIRPGAFGALFAVATAAGLFRIALIARLPEAPADPEEDMPRARPLALLRSQPPLRRYLLGVAIAGAARRSVVPFVVVLMRRVLGLSEADVLLTTVAFFAGGFASLYGWGRAVDRFGAAPVFAATGIGLALCYLSLLAVNTLMVSAGHMIGFFFVLAVLNAGFGVADTHVLFGLATAAAATRTLVVADVSSSLIYGVAPLCVGLALEAALTAGTAPLLAYRALFVVAAAATLAALVPLRHFRR